MLVLNRKARQSLTIGNDVTVTILEVRGYQVRLGIEAPKHVPVHRDEIYQRILRERKAAADLAESEHGSRSPQPAALQVSTEGR